MINISYNKCTLFSVNHFIFKKMGRYSKDCPYTKKQTAKLIKQIPQSTKIDLDNADAES